ncbi:MAG: TonB-dependent receptor [Xanthomonadales bacterium]|nr:TonB-dependent receptor [Xanthomonadales bacterium]
MHRESRIALLPLPAALALLLVGAPGVAPAASGTGGAWLATAAGVAEQPDGDPRHHDEAHQRRHAKDLEQVVVTASPLRDTAEKLSAPIEILSGEQLDEMRAASLGETVAKLPGVQSSNFGPGVGRPIIRGLDGARVEVLTGGMVTKDVSTVSQDHSPAIEPFVADQIEVLKGPSTLLYGSGAIGGVVNVVDGRIPTVPVEGFSGRAEARVFAGDQGGETDMARIDGGSDNFALHADAVYRNARNYDTPEGEQANTFIDTRTGAVGGSVFTDWGFVGVSASRFEDDYGNPGEPGDPDEGERGVHLELRQNRTDLKGAVQDLWGDGSALRFGLGHTDYEHIEFEGDETGTTFSKNATEGRLEASLALAGWDTALGMQGGTSSFEAVGEESFLPKTDTDTLGLFGVTRREWGEWQLDLGGRVDRVSSDPELGSARDFRPLSGSVGVSWSPTETWLLSLQFDHAERAPAEEELFSDGPHLATLAYEVGDSTLDKERSNQIELGVQFRSRVIDAKFSAYTSRFRDFIYLVDTDDAFYFEEEDEYLPIRRWAQSDARFHGLEGEVTFHLGDGDTGRWDLRAFGDSVRGALRQGGNLPRIAPSRLGADLRWAYGDFRASLGATRVARQDRVAENESATDGYTLVDAHLAYHMDGEHLAWEIFFDGNNLTDQNARVHTSFLKNDVLLPGRSYSGGVRVFF